MTKRNARRESCRGTAGIEGGQRRNTRRVAVKKHKEKGRNSKGRGGGGPSLVYRTINNRIGGKNWNLRSTKEKKERQLFTNQVHQLSKAIREKQSMQ
jgi:hypothetical protein